MEDLHALKKSAEAWADNASEDPKVTAVIIIVLHDDGVILQSGAKDRDPQRLCYMLCHDAAVMFKSGQVPDNTPLVARLQDGKLVPFKGPGEAS